MMTDDKLLENKMSDITELELDALIGDTFQRQAILESVHKEVMTEVRQQARCIMLRRWLRIAAFAFGVPFVFFCFAFGMYQMFVNSNMQQPYIWVVIILPTITILAYLNRTLRNFSIAEM